MLMHSSYIVLSTKMTNRHNLLLWSVATALIVFTHGEGTNKTTAPEGKLMSMNAITYDKLPMDNRAGYKAGLRTYKFLSIVKAFDADGSGKFCTGALIGPRAVVTLASCLHKAGTTTLYGTVEVAEGSFSRSYAEYRYPIKLTKDTTVYIHKSFDETKLNTVADKLISLNNIAVIVLPIDVSNLTDIVPVAVEEGIATSRLRTIGYGRNRVLGERNQYLREIDVIPETLETCKKTLDNTICDSPDLIVTTGKYTKRESLCHLEDGAPLVLRSAILKRKSLVGLGMAIHVTNDNTCNEDVNLSVFLNLKPYKAWLKSILDNIPK